MRTISSRQNQTVRAFRDLADRTDPTGARLLLDGAHLVREARAAGLAIEVAAVAASRLAVAGEEQQLAQALARDEVDVVIAPDPLFRALSPVSTPSGIVAIARRAPSSVEGICRQPGAFLLATVDVQDPGNIGSLLRVAEAGGVAGALVCASAAGSAANPFAWKALRGSMGSALRLPVAAGLDAVATCGALTQAGVRTIAAAPRGGREPDAIDWSGHVALILGGEGPGIPAALIDSCDDRVSIPMAAAVESLNVAAAGAILIYAARRQRDARVPLR